MTKAFFFLAVILFSCTALAVEPIDNLLPFELTNESGAVIAEIQIYEVSRQSDGLMDRPFVFVEGLDISDAAYGSFGRDQFESIFRSTSQGGGRGFWDILLDSGVDLYLVDIKSFDVRMEDLSELLKQSINYIWWNRTNQQEPFRMVGASMGGLIGRLALGIAEEQNVDHHTSHFASLDSPHRGAIIPLGIQGVLHFWSDFSSSVAELLAASQWQSVRQVLLRQMVERKSGNFLSPPQDYLDFMNRYTDRIPKIPKTVAFSNGSGFGEAQTFDPYLNPMFSFDYDPFGPGDFVVKITSFDETPRRIVYNYNNFGFFITLDEKSYSAELHNIEAAPGGYRDSYRQLQQEFGPALEDIGYSGAPPATIVDQGQHCFIPLASAIDLAVDTTTRDGLWSLPDNGAGSSFDLFYLAAANTEHVDLLPYIVPLEAELLDTVKITVQPSLLYDNGNTTPSFILFPTIGAEVYFAVEVTTDPTFFNATTTADQRNDTKFFSSWWGSSSSDTQGSLAPPIQTKAGTSPFSYSLPRSFMDKMSRPVDLFYRMRIFLNSDGSNAYSTTSDQDFLLSPVLTVRYTGDLNGDNDADGADLALLALAFTKSNPEADLNNDTMVTATDLAEFGIFFGKPPLKKFD